MAKPPRRRVTTEKVGPHKIQWEERPARTSHGHGVEFLWSGDDAWGGCVAFLVGFGWFHKPGQAPVVVELFQHGETGQPGTEGSAGEWLLVRAEAKEAVRRFLAKPDPGATYGGITVFYNT